jgi:hypothetical protein
LQSVRISEVWRLLGGQPLRHGRGKAFWRGGDGFNVAIDDDEGLWMDHVDGIGGGILDLILRVNGASRADALRWLADALGVSLEARQPDPLSKSEGWAIAPDRHIARDWRRGLVNVLDELLANLKVGLFEATLPQPDSGEILRLEKLRSYLRNLGQLALVQEYRNWAAKWPASTAALVRAAKNREAAEKRALRIFICGMANTR